MKKKSMFFLAAAAATVAYSAVTGKGVFNKIRFKKQHDVISRYVDAHYPGAIYTPIEQNDHGYVTVILYPGERERLLYCYETTDGDYVFTEAQAERRNENQS